MFNVLFRLQLKRANNQIFGELHIIKSKAGNSNVQMQLLYYRTKPVD